MGRLLLAMLAPSTFVSARSPFFHKSLCRLSSVFPNLDQFARSLRRLQLGLPEELGPSSKSYLLLAPLSFLYKNLIASLLIRLSIDVASAWLLSKAGSRIAGVACLWNPFVLLTCLCGPASSLYNLFLIATVAAAVAGRPMVAALSLACAGQLSIYALLFTVPILMLLWRSGQQEGGEQLQPAIHISHPRHPPPRLQHAEQPRRGRHVEEGDQERAGEGLRRRPPSAPSLAVEPPGAEGGGRGVAGGLVAQSCSSQMTWRGSGAGGRPAACTPHSRQRLLRCAAFLVSLAVGVGVGVLAEEGVVRSVASAAQRGGGGATGAGPLAWVRWSHEMGSFEGGRVLGGGEWWFLRRLRRIHRADDTNPNLGLAWYFFAEAFPKFRPFFLFCFRAMPAALALPMALRFPEQPMLCLLCQAITNCMLAPTPTYGDIALWLALLPLASPQVSALPGKGWWVGSFFLTLGLKWATYQLWWVRGIANANFFYGMNLAWAAWQALFIMQLVKTTVRLEAAQLHQREAEETGRQRDE